MRPIFMTLTAAAALLAGVSATPDAAEAASLTGSWRGSGTLTLSSGETERVRCKVNFSRYAGQTFNLDARCASTSGRIDQSGQVTRVSGNTFSGTVYSPQYSVSASVFISLNGNRQSVSISSPQGRADLSLRR